MRFKYFKIANDYLIFVKKIFISFFNFFLPNVLKYFNLKLFLLDFPISNCKVRISGNGNVHIGKKCIFGYEIGGRFYSTCVEIQSRYPSANIFIGDFSAFNNNIFICAANYIRIGKNSRIGEGVTIFDFDAHNIHPNRRNLLGEIGKVEIGDNVWIGNNTIILKNVVIGDNSIVAAGSVVTKSFGDNQIIGGNPAKILKSI
jgi:acetyltransferase-like isoleucine patch superfamily enzyme